MKFSKKLLAMVLSLSAVSQFIVPVSAQEFTQPDVVNIFDTIYGYKRDRVKQESNVLPNLPAGLTPNFNVHYNCNGLTSEVAEDGSNYVRISNEIVGGYANPEWVFDEVIKKGTVTLSFDMYYPWDENKNSSNAPYVYLDFINGSVNDNPTDKWTAGGATPSHDQLFTINEKAADGVVKVGTTTKPIADSIANRWTKVTVSINAETGLSVIYLNGEEFARRNMSNKGLKMLVLYVGAYDTTAFVGEVLFDNFYVRHTQADLEAVDAGADYEIGGVADGGKVRMGLSEMLNLFKEEPELYPEDFVLKNSAGETVDGAITFVETAEDKKAEIVFTVEGLSKGTYTIGISDEVKESEFADLYKGVLSGNFPEDITFTVKGDEQNKKDVRRYYINEDFENYNGGHPEGVLQKSIYNMNHASNMVAVENENGTGFAFKNPDYAIWEFDKPFMGGKLFVEFDVKANGSDIKDGRWTLNLLKARDFLPDNYVPGDYWEVYQARTMDGIIDTPKSSQDVAQYNYYTSQLNAAWAAASAADNTLVEADWKANWLKNEWPAIWESYRVSTDAAAVNLRAQSRQQSIARSAVIGTSMDATKFAYAPNRKDYGGYASTYVADTFPRVKQGEWTHVKVEIDTEAGQYILTVGGETLRLDYDLANFMVGGQSAGSMPAYATSYDINTGKLKLTPGFGGISFRGEDVGTAGLQNAVELDNIQVYTEDSYNSYSEFNNVAAHGQATKIAVSEQNGVYGGPNMPDWYSPQHLNVVHYQRVDNGLALSKGAGRNSATDSNDKALMINCGYNGTGVLVHPFNVPVKAGREFNVEFDYKSSSTQPLNIGLIESGNLAEYELAGWHYLNNTNMSGMIEDTKGNTAASGNYNGPTSRTMLSNWDENFKLASDGFAFRGGQTIWHENGGRTQAVLESDETTKVKYVKGEWNHIKLNVKSSANNRIQLQLTVTYEDGTSMTSQPYETNVAMADIAAMLFKFNLENSNGTAIRNHQHFIDNFAVYEVGSASNAYVTGITAKDADGTESVVTDSFKKSTTELLVNFSHKLTNADGVFAVKADGTEVAATKSISDNGLSAVITLNEVLEPGEKVTVKVAQTQGFETSTYLEKMESYAKTFTVEDVSLPLNIEELRLYKWHEARANSTETWLLSGEGYFPLTAAELSDLSSADSYKVVVNGYNYSGESYTLSLVKATYNEGRLENVEIIPKTVTEGVFDISEEVTFQDLATGNVKYFIWNNATPLAENLDYNMTVTTVTE